MEEKKHKLTKIDLAVIEKTVKRDRAEVDKLFLENINLANKMAAKYYKTGYFGVEEALQTAKLGLWVACLTWEPEKAKLSTLAYRIMTQEFCDYDTRFLKNQPDIVFNIEEETVQDEDITFGDILKDEFSNVEDGIEQSESLKQLNERIIKILDEISIECNIDKSLCKLIYIVNIEANQDKEISFRDLNFIPKATRTKVISLLQDKLNKLSLEDNEDVIY